MALQINYPSDLDVNPFASAYAKIETIAIEIPVTGSPFLVVTIPIWVNAQARNGGKRPLDRLTIESTEQQYTAFVNVCVVGGNPVNIIYYYLKTRPPFSGGADV